MRIAAYYRVSTSRQADKDLSIPDQKRQVDDYCKHRDWTIVREFVEPGASGTIENRPAFQEMLGYVCQADRPVDAVIVHSFSRFFRDAFELEFQVRRLKRHNVALISITQEVSDDPQGDLIRSVITNFDAYSSAENAKHTLRGMQENARQGFWNGAKPPFGYKTIEAERRGDKIKKKLAIDEDEARQVKRIFDLYIQGDGANGPMGIKAIVNHLNERGILRRGRKFYVSNVHDILQRTAYIGTHHFNCIDSKTRKSKPRAEWIELTVPAIISKDQFAKVQKTLKAKRPTNTPPRVVSGPTLLTGLLKCGTCGGSMSLRTGKGGRYRYYACSTNARKGKSECPGRSIRMDFMDEVILQELRKKLFLPERLYVILAELMDRSENGKNELKSKLKGLQKEHKAKETALSNLYKAIEEGIVDFDDPQLRERIANTKAFRDELSVEVDLLTRQIHSSNPAITKAKLEAFATRMQAQLSGDNPAMQKAYLNLFIKQIILRDDEIEIVGSKQVLAQGANTPEKLSTTTVPSFVREWHALRDSNPCFRRERAAS